MGRSDRHRGFSRRQNLTGYLIDTNTALIGLANPSRLSRAALAAIKAGPNILSPVTFWEVMLKCMKGKLDVGDPRGWWRDALDQLSAVALPMKPDHVAQVYRLPAIHSDPFDRILIAQAGTESLTLVTTNRAMRSYANSGIWIIC